jgi:Mrp family chromosome partitioning ATPase
LAPKIDATLFVVRLSYTSARLTKKALELLYSRQVNVPGVILNFVDTSLPEYYYYQYSEYYSTPSVPDGEAVAQVRRERPRPIETA